MLLLRQCPPKNKRKFPPFLSPRFYLILILHLSYAQITKEKKKHNFKREKKKNFPSLQSFASSLSPFIFLSSFLPSYEAPRVAQ